MTRVSYAAAAVLVTGGLLGGLVSSPAAQVANGSTREKLVVTPAWLAGHLNDRDLVILQVGRKATYDAGHIPGARLVDFDAGALAAPMDHSGRDPNHVMLEMPPPDQLREQLAALGISDDSRIVVVPADNYWSPSTRVVLTLDYAGLSNVSWLDGGTKGWVDYGRSLTAEVPAVKPGNLSPLKIRPIVVDHDFVLAHIRRPGFAIVDARNRSFYDGIPPQRASSGAPPRLGHIPGALSAPYDQFAAGNAAAGGTTLKPAEEIEAMFRAAGVKPGDTIIGYCHIGQQATAMLFAARTAGYNVLLYDGSFTEWQKRDLPVENPSAKKDK
jgi:thiosulfate/3-mercaptopyruvate sulfurtransferase